MDQTVLSYHDHLLRKSDLLLLENGNWINDNIIGFMFEYFHHSKFRENSMMVSFVDPDVVQLVKLCAEEDAKQILKPLALDTKQVIFLPINDNEDALRSGGSHWSLMVFDCSMPFVEHYDSCPGYHADTAVDVFEVFSKHIFRHEDDTELRQMPIAEQTNGYDCGIYVIKITEEVCRAKMQGSDWDATELTSPAITEYRRKIKHLIHQLSSQHSS